MKRRHALVVERDFDANKNVEDDTEAPDVNFGADTRITMNNAVLMALFEGATNLARKLA
ncbi:hypothetical protein C0995_000981, partial [Termitomyces sp. Mi166